MTSKHYAFSFLLALLCQTTLSAQNLYFPPVAGTTWDTVSPAALGWCPDKIAPLLDYLGTKNTKAFILLQDGKIAIEKYYGAFTKDSAWYWASAGKTLTAFTVGLAQQEGYLSISDTSSKYLGPGWTACPPNKEDKITIRHQLTMTTGLNDGVPDPYCTIDTCLIYKADAGARWAYHNGPYTLLDGVIEGATGKNLNAYVTAKLSSQTGITGIFLPSGYNNLFYSKPRSMARFGLLLLNRGTWNSTPILSDTAYFDQMTNTSQDLNKSYGYLTWLGGKSSFRVPGLQLNFPGSWSPNAPADMFAALGKNGQLLNVVPSRKLVFVRMGDAPGAGEVPFTMNDTIWQYLNAVFCNATGLAAEVAKNDVQLFPNPVENQLNFSGEGLQEPFRVSVYSIEGRLVLAAENTRTLDVSLLKRGLYFVWLESRNGIYPWKLIKQ